MKLGRILLFGAALALGGASAAQAGTKIMATPPIVTGAPVVGQTMYCDMNNLNTTDKQVTFEIMDLAGAVVSGPLSLTLSPGTGQALGSNAATAAWCRFTVDGSPKKYRGIAIYDNGNDYTVSVPAK